MKLLLILVLLPVAAAAAQTPARSSYAQSWDELLHRAADNHAPAPEEIAAAGSPATQPDAKAVAEALPSIRKALLYADPTIRAYALTALNGLEIPSPAPETSAKPAATAPEVAAASAPPKPDPAPTGPGTYSSEVRKALSPAIPDIANNLTDDLATNRILAAADLAGFAPDPPPSIFPPLLSYLKRDDGIGPTGAAVVDDLLQFSPIAPATASALVSYLRRSDQTADSRSSLIDSVAGHANQSQQVDKALLAYLNTDDPSVRARLILSLPQLDLAPEVFADTRSQISVLATDNQENLQVVNAAKAVATCWTGTRMPSGCPVY